LITIISKCNQLIGFNGYLKTTMKDIHGTRLINSRSLTISTYILVINFFFMSTANL